VRRIPWYVWAGRVWKRHRQQIRERLGFRPAAVADASHLTEWLSTSVVGAERNEDHLVGHVRARCREMRIEPPTLERTQRIVRSAVHQYEQRLYAKVYGRLSAETRAGLDALLGPLPGEGAADGLARAVLNQLRADAGRPSVRSVQEELAKLTLVRILALPADLFYDVSSAEIELRLKNEEIMRVVDAVVRGTGGRKSRERPGWSPRTAQTISSIS
jgi:hypothetical protein